MFDALLAQFQNTPLSLWGPFGVLLLCGLGLPIPEDVVLIAAGALGQIDGRSWVDVSVVMYAGVMIGDSTIFLAGHYFGGRLRKARWFQRVFPLRKQDKVEALFDRYHSMGLFIGRFLPGLRAPLFFTAGSTKVKFWKFLFFDGLAAVISVPFFVWLGDWLWAEFATDLEHLERVMGRTHTITLMVAGALLVVVLGALWRHFRNAKALPDKET